MHHGIEWLLDPAPRDFWVRIGRHRPWWFHALPKCGWRTLWSYGGGRMDFGVPPTDPAPSATVFIRHPLDRMARCWLTKCRHAITFEEFVTACCNSDDTELNPHVRSQASLVRETDLPQPLPMLSDWLRFVGVEPRHMNESTENVSWPEVLRDAALDRYAADVLLFQDANAHVYPLAKMAKGKKR